VEKGIKKKKIFGGGGGGQGTDIFFVLNCEFDGSSVRYHSQPGSRHFLASCPVHTGLCFCRCKEART